jgi:NADPH2:quinone reductase
MKALLCTSLNGDLDSLALVDMNLGDLEPDTVRIRVHAASVNFPDLLMTEGKYQFRPEPPYVVGGEAAGEVIAVGEAVCRFRIGDRVVGGGLTGGFAQELQRPESAFRPIPGDADFASAAAFTTAYLTAHVALVRRARIEPGEWLLVHGAAGGMGLAAVDLGRHLGARVIATASSQTKRDVLLQYGAEHVMAPTEFRERVKAITDGRGADVIYDPVGGDVFDESTRCIAFDGRLLIVGFTSGRIPTVSVNMPLIKGFSVVGVRAGEYGRRFPDRGRENIATIDRLLSERSIRPYIGARFPLTHAVEAMKTLRDRTIIGKAIIEPSFEPAFTQL